MPTYTGQFGDFEWLETTEFSIGMLLTLCPEILIAKCLVITSFDSGPLEATPDERAQGWEQHGDIVVLPHVGSVASLPYDQYDEWYVFPEYVVPAITETFANDGILTLRSPQSLIDEAKACLGSQADLVGERYRASRLSERQDLFWDGISRIRPESYIASGDRFVFVSQRHDFFERVCTAARPE